MSSIDNIKEADGSVSVIVPIRGKIELLRRAIQSVFIQTRPATEVIVVDDSINRHDSSDISSILNEFGIGTQFSQFTVPIVYLKSNGGGVSKARNLGISHSRSEFIAFLDADDYFLPEKIEVQVRTMNKFNANFSHTNYLAVHAQGKTRVVDTSFNSGENQHQIISYRGCAIATPTVMIRRSLIAGAEELFPENYSIGEDQIAWARCASANPSPILQIQDVLSVVTVNQNSSSQIKENIILARANLLEDAKIRGYVKPGVLQYGGLKKIVMRIVPIPARYKLALLTALQVIKDKNNESIH